MKTRELKKLKEIKLSDSEKKDLFARVSNSIREMDNNVNLNYPVPSPFFRFTYIFESRLVKVGAMAVFILFLTSATAFASLNTLPGDLLYGVKTKVVEKIPKLLHVSPESRAEYSSKKVERRIEEFEKLAEKGRLTKENTRILEKDINKNLGDFDNNIREIKNKKNREESRPENTEKEILERELEAKLQKHSEKIERIREEESDEESSVKNALQSVLERAYRDRGDTEIIDDWEEKSIEEE